MTFPKLSPNTFPLARARERGPGGEGKPLANYLIGPALVAARLLMLIDASGTVHHVKHPPVVLRVHGRVAAALSTTVMQEISWVRSRIERDLGTRVGTLQIELYGTHGGFAKALWREQHARPQTLEDNASAIVHGTLLLGPLAALYLRHDLVHVYTEWVLDRLTGNRDDALPPNPWLYDGLAEVEAYRYAPGALECRLGGDAPLDITRLRTAGAWLAVRGGPMGPLEYCLAYGRVRALIRRDGFGRVLGTIRRLGWRRAGEALDSTLTYRPGRRPKGASG